MYQLLLRFCDWLQNTRGAVAVSIPFFEHRG
jgi:hypothetical protein